MANVTTFKCRGNSPLASAGFRATVSALVDAATHAAVEDLSGLRECLMTGKLIPAGTGFGAYREIDPKAAPDTTAATEAIR